MKVVGKEKKRIWVGLKNLPSEMTFAYCYDCVGVGGIEKDDLLEKARLEWNSIGHAKAVKCEPGFEPDLWFDVKTGEWAHD